MPKKILVVEDDRSLAKVLEYNLSTAGYDVSCAYDGQDGFNQAIRRSPDLIILDVMIPVVDGIETCKKLRAQRAFEQTPIMLLTAKGEEIDQLVGFSVGADDYVTKPFSVKILLQRVKSLLKRQQSTHDSDVVVAGKIRIDRVKHRASIEERPMDLTPSEFRLLDTLIRQPGRAFDRSELIDSALGADTLVLERTIDVHIRSLRKKLGESALLIETVRGIGYRFGDATNVSD